MDTSVNQPVNTQLAAEIILQHVRKEIDTFEDAESQLKDVSSAKMWYYDLKSQLERIKSDLRNKSQLSNRDGLLAWLNEYLGDFDEAERNYLAAIQNLPSASGVPNSDFTQRFCSSFRDEYDVYNVESLLNYLTFCVEHRRNLQIVETILDIMPWLKPAPMPLCATDLHRGKMLFLVAQLANAQRSPIKASRHLEILDAIREQLPNRLGPGLLELEQALSIPCGTVALHQSEAREAVP
jgi:tetratricopeptide (TPR) repeat protein